MSLALEHARTERIAAVEGRLTSSLRQERPRPSPHVSDAGRREALEAATAEWLRVLGEEGVVLAGAAEQAYGANTLAIARRIPRALRPTGVEQVAALVRISAKYKIPLYPISTGKNWGYGSANPVQDGSVVVDLSRLNRIVAMDRELGLVTVEPGVTQQQLAEYLDGQNLPFLVPVTGAGPTASLLGNAMERGYGITPHADHFAAVTALEAVLPNGDLYRSALSALGGERVDRAFKWGLGPYLDGLFTQGNLGIVTQVTLALAPQPERIEAFFFSLRREEDLEPAVTAIRDVLRSIGGVMGSANLMDTRRMLAMVEPYPKGRVASGAIMPEALVQELAQPNRFTAWTGMGALYGDRRVVRAAKAVLRERLRPLVKRLVFVTPQRARWARRIVDLVPVLRRSRLAHLLERVESALTNLAGRPSEIALPLAYWKSGVRPAPGQPLDPARDGCGLIWYAPLVPMIPERVRAYVESVRKICAAHGIEPLITLTSLSERCFDSTVPLLFNRNDPQEAARAHACYDALFEAGRREGFLPYRLGVNVMSKAVDAASPCWRLNARIKRAVDPDNLIAPGRYAL